MRENKIITLYCIVDREVIPEKRARRKFTNTCSPGCLKKLHAHKRALQELAKCRSCFKPSTPEERRSYQQWRKAQPGYVAAKRGRKPKAAKLDAQESLNGTHDLLLLVGYDVPLRVIEKWTPEELGAAENWAARSYSRASDNPVKVPAMPAFLDQWKWEHNYPRPG